MALFYDRDFVRNGKRGYDDGFRKQRGWGGHQREMGWGQDRYDRGYKSRWQTDYGDPFGDRVSRTPMRMVRGEFRGDHDRFGGEFRSDRDRFGRESYDRDYSSSPMGYDPYFDNSRRPSSGGHRDGYGRGFGDPIPRGRGLGRGYDRGWF